MATELIDTILETEGIVDPGMRADNLTAKAMTDFFRGDFLAADSLLVAVREQTPEGVQEERALSRWQFPNDPVGTGHLMYALARWERGSVADFDVGIADAERRVNSLAFPHGPFTLACCLCHKAWVATELGEYDRAQQIADQLVFLSTEHGFDYWLLTGLAAAGINAARRELNCDNPDPAVIQQNVAAIGESTAVQQMVGAEQLLPYFVSALGDIVAAAGDPDAGLAHLDEAVTVANRTESRYYLAETHRVRARVMRDQDSAGALDELWRAQQLAHQQGSVPYEYRALVDLAAMGEDVDELMGQMPDDGAVVAGLAPGRHQTA
jgi:tetratricopeptide (TPR) repeat protein